MVLAGVESLFNEKLGITLPAYIGAMIVGATFRNINDKTQWIKIDQQSIDFAGEIALNIFLTVALMDLKLWELAYLAVPLAGILATQVVVAVLFAITITFLSMGKNYESAVMSSGFIGCSAGRRIFHRLHQCACHNSFRQFDEVSYFLLIRHVCIHERLHGVVVRR